MDALNIGSNNAQVGELQTALGVSSDNKFGTQTATALIALPSVQSIVQGLLIPTTTVPPVTIPPVTTNPLAYLKGLDLYQDTINSWVKAYAAGFHYAWIKASDGSTTRVQFGAYFGPAKAALFKVGPYHFYQPSVDVQTQINVFVQQIKAAGWKAGVDLPPVLDFETFSSTNGPTATDYANANAFMLGLQAVLGVKIIIYASDSVIVNAPSWISKDVVWDARYGNTPSYTNWLFFQNSESGSVPGVNDGAAETDTDLFRGTDADLEAFIVASVLPAAVATT